ncbi:chalcone isomerase family protein [Desulfatibacillum aliphaticivorans]|uniref:chalcone isomerase family protein n=1 Tax=Desulfatibacillum aliphaticivorans TaxID=218208 RepID=UPI0003FADE29|nr:chalcone isomerase family protein [Desulfatibacillum aliphaticivorans]
MKKVRQLSSFIFILCLICALTAPALAKDFHGWPLPDKMPADESTDLVLNGAGFRTKFLLKIYVGALYLTHKETDANKIINADEYMGVRMHFTFRKVGHDSLVEILNTGFDKATNGDTSGIQSQIDHLFALLPQEFRKNDIVDLLYVPGRGIVTHINGKYAGECPGLDFKQAVFAIWLGDEPVTEKLKAEMLGIETS